MPSLLQFGAGRIGRSFIAQLFSQNGYDVIFIDIDKAIIDELNSRKSYPVIIKAHTGDELIDVKNVSGIMATDKEAVENAVAAADIASVSVGQAALPAVSASIANGLIKRHDVAGIKPLDIILAENMRNADIFVMDKLKASLPKGFPAEEMAGLIETSIGKMVPIMPEEEIKKDPLKVYAEPYNTLILDKKGFKNRIPKIEGLAPKENIKAWVDRKLFIHNLGHAATAYIGNFRYPNKKYIWEVLEDSFIENKVKETMLQAANVLLLLYPNDFTIAGLNEHITNLVNRFKNKALGDTVFRVGCGLERKLGTEDRIAAPLRLAHDNNLPYSGILYVFLCALHFNAKDKEGNMLEKDKLFNKQINKGWEHVLSTTCGLTPAKHKAVFEDAEKTILRGLL